MYIVNRTILICCNTKLQKYSASSKFDGVRLSDDLDFMCILKKIFLKKIKKKVKAQVFTGSTDLLNELLDGVDSEDDIDASHPKKGDDSSGTLQLDGPQELMQFHR